jgi:ADP-heptose:LPS heptosyltransferase
MQILVIRASAMGDVALVTPVLAEMKKKYPEVDIILLTRSSFKSFFSESDHFKVFTPDFKERHRGLPGILRLYRDLKIQFKIDRVIDIHDVLRSKILRSLFILGGTPVSVIDKGRAEKRNLISGKRKVQLKHTVVRYSDVFRDAGFYLDPSEKRPIVTNVTIPGTEELFKIKRDYYIGIAPYALHKLKMWPEENMIRLMKIISEKYDVAFYLFGGIKESPGLEKIASLLKGAVNLAGILTLEEELAVMKNLDFMIAMDSSNMHMAALVGTNVISIWGGTDPLNGFGAWMQPDEYSIRIPVTELTCRPCTIFGKGECKRGDFACMNWLTPEMVYQKIKDTGLI